MLGMSAVAFDMKKRVAIPLTIAVLALISIPFIMKKQSSQDTTQYQTALVSTGTLTSTISGSGNLYVDSTATVNSSVSGTVRNLKVSLGAKVTKGQTLYTVDDSGTLDSAVRKAAGTITQSKQTLESARTQLLQAEQDVADANTKNTNAAGTVSDTALAILNQKVVAARVSVESATNGVTTAQADYDLAKTNTTKRTVTAPIDGTITTLSLKNGDTVSGGSSSAASSTSTASLIIDNLNTLKAKVSINEVDAIATVAGQTASLTFDAISDLTVTGKVERVSLTGTVSNGVVTYDAILALDAQNDRLRPQMTATATITTNVKQNVISIPTTAIKTSSDTSYVQVMESGQPRQQTVTLGISNDSNTEITAGLNAGQTIVTSTVTGSSSTATTSTKSQTGGAVRGGFGVPGL